MLCSRGMRKWAFDYNQIATSYEDYDPASSDGPHVAGSFRHDTLMQGNNSVLTFDDQSDDIPTQIIPKMYGTSNRYFSTRLPASVAVRPSWRYQRAGRPHA